MDCYIPDTMPVKLLCKVRQEWLCQLNDDDEATWIGESLLTELFPTLVIPDVPETNKTKTSVIANLHEYVQHPWVEL